MDNEKETRIGGIQKQLFQSKSLLKGYQLAVVGSKGKGTLLYFEMMGLIADFVPGVLGNHFRRVFYSPLFWKIGRRVKLGKHIVFRHPNRIRIGDGVVIGNHVSLNIKDKGEAIIIGDDTTIGENTIFSCSGGTLYIGKRARIGRNCRIGSLKGLKIGDDFEIGVEGCIVGASHVYHRLDIPIIDQPLDCRAETIIGNNVKLEKQVTLLDGVEIGDDVSIGEGSFVNRKIPNGIHGSGVPVRLCEREKLPK